VIELGVPNLYGSPMGADPTEVLGGGRERPAEEDVFGFE
jgi:hypothetical protein